MPHAEMHRVNRVGWLRAAVLGANDGIVSTASLIIGVAAAGATTSEILTAGVAGLVAGAMSMAAGEFVSVSSQADTERADLERERRELEVSPRTELAELTGIYISRGLEPELARTVAVQLTAHDALGAHARDELGLTETLGARPLQAAVSSAATFAGGAALPLSVVLVTPMQWLIVVVGAASLVFLAGLGAVSSRLGGAPVFKAVFRVALWGSLAMALTAGIGWLFGAVV